MTTAKQIESIKRRLDLKSNDDLAELLGLPRKTFYRQKQDPRANFIASVEAHYELSDDKLIKLYNNRLKR